MDRKLGIFGSVTEKQRQVCPWGLLDSQPDLLGEYQTIEKPCLKERVDSILRTISQGCPLTSTCIPTHTIHMHICMPVCTRGNEGQGKVSLAKLQLDAKKQELLVLFIMPKYLSQKHPCFQR